MAENVYEMNKVLSDKGATSLYREEYGEYCFSRNRLLSPVYLAHQKELSVAEEDANRWNISHLAIDVGLICSRLNSSNPYITYYSVNCGEHSDVM